MVRYVQECAEGSRAELGGLLTAGAPPRRDADRGCTCRSAGVRGLFRNERRDGNPSRGPGPATAGDGPEPTAECRLHARLPTTWPNAAGVPARQPETGEMQTALRGVGVSHGVVTGTVRQMGSVVLEPPDRQIPAGDAPREQGPRPAGGRVRAGARSHRHRNSATAGPARRAAGRRASVAPQPGGRTALVPQGRSALSTPLYAVVCWRGGRVHLPLRLPIPGQERGRSTRYAPWAEPA